MSGAAKQLLDLLQTLGLVAPEKLANYLPPRPLPTDVQELARELIRKGDLTKFQAQELLSGRGKKLVLGNYVVLDKLGAGGMGQVFKAQHKRMKRIVAIKTLPSSVTKDATALGRFQREVEAAAKLTHANVVAAYDADEADGVHFLVMEFVNGPDLNVLLKQKGKLPVADVMKFIAQAAEGLAFAHAKGVVHRDIKPGNLLVDQDGTVKLLDLGLARLEEEATSGPRPDQQDLTQAGLMMGTVDFMAPEQARNLAKADAKSDVYSLGCTMHRLLTAAVLYPGETVVDKLWAHRENPIPSLRTVRPDVPPPLDALFQRMIAKKPDDRPAMAEIAAFLKTPQATAVPTALSLPAAVSPPLSAPLPGGLPLGAPAVNPFGPAVAGPVVRAEGSEAIFAPAPSSTNLGLDTATIGIAAMAPTTMSPANMAPSAMSTGAAAVAAPMMTSRRPVAPPKKLNPMVLFGVGGAVIVVLAIAVGVMLGGKSDPPPPQVALAPKAAPPVVPASPPSALPPPVSPPPTVLQPASNPVASPAGGNMFTLPPSNVGTAAPANPTTPAANPIATSLPSNSIFTPGGPAPSPAAPPTPSAALPATPGAQSQTASASGLFTAPITGFGNAANPGPPRADAPFDAAKAKEFQKSWADYLGVPVASQNAVGIRLQLIPPGSFLMGSTDAEVQAATALAQANNARPTQLPLLKAESPQHKVTLTKPFLCGETEVTVAQYRKFVEATKYVTWHERELAKPDNKIGVPHRYPWHSPQEPSGPDYPVVLVTWFDAQAFCNWLSAQEGLMPVYPEPLEPGGRRTFNVAANGYSLLTEAQWEFACRAGTQTAYSFGDDPKLLDEYAWHFGNSSDPARPVGKKRPNAFGLFDMHGGIAEWTYDFYRPYRSDEHAIDPVDEGSNAQTAVRGKILEAESSQYRSAVRRQYSNQLAAMYVGFRVGRVLEPLPAKAK